MVKRWLITTTRYQKPGSHLEFFLKIQHVHGQKMIDRGGDCYTKDLLQARVTNCLFLWSGLLFHVWTSVATRLLVYPEQIEAYIIFLQKLYIYWSFNNKHWGEGLKYA